MANTLDVTGGAECMTVINRGLIVLPDKGGMHLKDVDSTDDDSLSENPPSISSVRDCAIIIWRGGSKINRGA